MPSKEIVELKTERERLRQEHAAGASGLLVARALSDAMDRAAVSIWQRLDPDPEAALVAVGGYGRGLLSPFSDIDLIVLHPKVDKIAPAYKSLSYELWDSGLELSHGVFSPKESIRLARTRFDVEASYRDGRILAGNTGLFEKWAADLRKLRGFPERLEDAAVRRWRASGDAGTDLEPDIKEARGGLRDLAVLHWLDAEDQETEAASDFLNRVRNQLHWQTGRRTDRLMMQLQAEVAAGVESFPALIEGLQKLQTQEEELLRSVYLAARLIGRRVETVMGITTGSPAAASFENAFAAEGWGPASREAFAALLRESVNDEGAFWILGEEVLLSAIPEWRTIHCLPQRNVYHRHAADVHSVEVAREVARLSDHPDDFIKRVARDGKGDVDVLMLAGLFHDIGKGRGRKHAETGAALAREACTRMGLDTGTAEEIVWLVRNHLLLTDTATRRDIGDEAIVIELAEKVDNPARLRRLFLLSVADGIATGPAAWSLWKSTLVSRLFSRVNHLLEEGTLVGGDVSEQAHRNIEELKKRLAHLDGEEVERHLELMPRAWLISQGVDALARQSEVMIRHSSDEEVHLTATPEQEAGIWEVVVVGRDRPGLVSKISGAFALHGLNVAGAQIFTREDGLALDVFRVAEVGAEAHRFERVAQDAVKALKGRLSLDLRLAEKQKDQAKRVQKGKRRPPEIVVDNAASDFYTVIEVHATDRVGLLYELTKTLSDLGLDIHLAKVSTLAEDVIDVFYVRDLDGQKIVDGDHLREVDLTLKHTLRGG